MISSAIATKVPPPEFLTSWLSSLRISLMAMLKIIPPSTAPWVEPSWLKMWSLIWSSVASTHSLFLILYVLSIYVYRWGRCRAIANKPLNLETELKALDTSSWKRTCVFPCSSWSFLIRWTTLSVPLLIRELSWNGAKLVIISLAEALRETPETSFLPLYPMPKGALGYKSWKCGYLIPFLREQAISL